MQITNELIQAEIYELSIPTGNSLLDSKREFRKRLLEQFKIFLPDCQTICPKCGKIENSDVIDIPCPMCSTPMILMPFYVLEAEKKIIREPEFDIIYYLLDKSLSLDKPEDVGYLTGTNIDVDSFNKTKNYIEKKSQNNNTLTSNTISAQNTPKCPTCGSTNIKHISAGKRWLTTGLFGLASSNVGKTYECLNCKYKW